MQIKVEQFEGPLDLLLQLIEQQQLDITAVSLANVTEQFLAYVKSLPTSISQGEVVPSMEQANPINLADFLVIAAKLLVIKSKSLLPNLAFDMEEEEAAYDLTKQLLQYKKYKEVAKFLKTFDSKRRQSWSRDPEFYDRITFLPDPDINANSLASSLKKLATELKEIVKLPKKIMEEVVSISEKITHIQKLIADKAETTLSSLLKESKNKTDVIVTFLALLELCKQRILVVEQNKIFDDIIIKKLT